MAKVEAIRCTPAQRADAYWHHSLISLREHPCKHGGTNALALHAGLDIKMIQEKMIALRLDYDEPHSCMCHDNVVRVLRREACCKPLSGTRRIKTPYPLHAFSHSFDAKCYQSLQVASSCSREFNQVRWSVHSESLIFGTFVVTPASAAPPHPRVRNWLP